MGHETSQCFLFRDLVKNSLNYGRLKFAGKSKAPMKIDSDLLQVGEARYVEPVEINMVEIIEYFDMQAREEVVESNENQMQSVYPKTEEGLVNFLHRC